MHHDNEHQLILPGTEYPVFDHDEQDHFREIPGYVHYVADAFEELLGISLERWARHLLRHPNAAEHRLQWIRLAGLMKAYTASPNGIGEGTLSWILRFLPTSPPEDAFLFLKDQPLGITAAQEIMAAYYSEGPRPERFVDGLRTHGLPEEWSASRTCPFPTAKPQPEKQ